MLSDSARPLDPADEVLARRVQTGDRDALDVLVARYLRPIHAVVASFLSDRTDVEDAVQDTFMRAIGTIHSYSASRPFAPWLYEIARNVARSRLSSSLRSRAEPMVDDVYRDPAPGPHVHAEQSDIRRRVAAALLELPEQQRIVFRMHDVEEFDTTEIARIMGLTNGTVRSHLHYARHALRGMLADFRSDSNEGAT